MLVQVWPLVHRNDVFPIRRVLVQNFDMGHSPHSALIIGKSKFMSESTCLDLECQAISPDIQSDTLQVKSQILVKQTDWCYILGYPEPPIGTQVKHILIIFISLLMASLLPLKSEENRVLSC